MSDRKIKSKDLSYDFSLPPFLQRLHDLNAGRGDTDRHERASARPKKVKTEDDGPTIVDDSGETLSTAEFEKLTADTAPKDDAPGVTGNIDPNAEPKVSGALPSEEQSVSTATSGRHRTEQKMTDGTTQKKRKLGKSIGEDTEESKSEDASTIKSVKKVKRKVKPVKLAFGDDDAT